MQWTYCDQEMGIVHCVIILRSVPFKCHAAVARRALGLVKDALRKAFGNEQIVPEGEGGIDGGSSLSSCAHLRVGVRVRIDGSNSNDAVSGEHAARTAPAVESDCPRGCISVIEVVVLGWR